MSAYDIGKPGNANYDEAKANPYPKLPALLVMNDGTKVKTPAQWKKRREEIKAMFDDHGKRVRRAEPSMPVEILGLLEVPQAGDPVQSFEDEREAKMVAEQRQMQRRFENLASALAAELFDQIDGHVVGR